MKPEYAEKFEIIKKLFIPPSREEINNITDEEIDQKNDLFDNMLDELTKSRDPEVLRGLLDFYTNPNSVEWGGFLGGGILTGAIVSGFEPLEFIDALYEKFDDIYGDNGQDFQDIECFCWDIWEGDWPRNFGRSYFPEFRQMFNTIKSKHSKRFLKEMETWCVSSKEKDKRKAMIETLREDMKKWGREGGSEKAEKAEGSGQG
jgi:hypothetical protein